MTPSDGTLQLHHAFLHIRDAAGWYVADSHGRPKATGTVCYQAFQPPYLHAVATASESRSSCRVNDRSNSA